ncbi:MAG: P-type conjugative transfer protein TrbL [Bacilli bacterium]|nr:P-type conjugative transfer protein TrbL [Bacilli bacterium]
MKSFILILVLLLVSTSAFAGIDPNTNQANSLLSTFQSASNSWRAAVVPAAKYVFFSLVVIDFVLDFGFIALKDGLNFDAFFAPLMRKTLIVGFFLMLFQFSTWLASIPNSLAQIGNNAAGVAVSPDNILLYALKMVNTIWSGISVLAIGDSLVLVFAGIVLLVAFGLMGAQLFVTYVKMYALLAISPLIFSLAGLGQTRQMAVNPIFAIIKVGMELMLIKMFLGLTITKIQSFAANVDTDNSSVMTMIVVSILMVSVVMMIPSMVEAVANGSLGSNSTAGLSTARSMMSGATGAAAGAIGGAIGMGAAVKAASALTKEQKAGGDSSASTFKNLRSALFSDVGRSMAGENYGGTMGGRMAFKHANAESLGTQKQAQKAVNDGVAPKSTRVNVDEGAFANKK